MLRDADAAATTAREAQPAARPNGRFPSARVTEANAGKPAEVAGLRRFHSGRGADWAARGEGCGVARLADATLATLVSLVRSPLPDGLI